MEVAIPAMAMSVGLLIVAMVFLLPVIIVWMIIKATGSHSKARSLSQEEFRLVQEIHNDLGRMEQRIESLEAILFDKMKTRV
jgi:phage shock protein B